MKLKYRYSESTIKPEILQMNRDNTVYVRKDIAPEVRSCNENNKITYWTYQEALLTREEFHLYAAENSKQIITNQENSDYNQMVIMEAIAEIYEIITNRRQEDVPI